MRPGFRKALRVILPVLAIVAAWQVWDNIENRRIADLRDRLVEVSRAAIGGSQPPLGSQGNEAARLYAAAAMVAQPADVPAGRSLYALVLQRDALARGEAVAPEVAADGAAFVARNAMALQLMDEANTLAFRTFTPSHQFGQRVFGLLSLSRAAAHRTLALIEAGDADAAVDALLGRLTLFRVLGRDGWGDGEIEAKELRDAGTDVGVLLTWTQPSPARLAELTAALEAAEQRLDLVEAFANIALYHDEATRSLSDGRAWQYGLYGPVLRPALRHNGRVAMQTGEDALAAARLPWPQRIAAMKSVTDRGYVLPLPGRVFREAWQIAWRFQSITSASASAVASLRAARAAIAAVSGQSVAGEDPFDGAPLRQLRSDAGLIIYSIGPNGKDDGGVLTVTPPKGATPGRGVAPDVGVRVVYRRAASIKPSNSSRNSPVR